MRRVPNRQERLAGLFVVLGTATVFGPVIWLLGVAFSSGLVMLILPIVAQRLAIRLTDRARSG